MKVVVIRDKCIGAGNCVGIAPKTFQLDAQKKIILLDARAHDDAALFEAAESCPVEAIHLFEDEGGQIYP